MIDTARMNDVDPQFRLADILAPIAEHPAQQTCGSTVVVDRKSAVLHSPSRNVLERCFEARDGDAEPLGFEQNVVEDGARLC